MSVLEKCNNCFEVQDLKDALKSIFVKYDNNYYVNIFYSDYECEQVSMLDCGEISVEELINNTLVEGCCDLCALHIGSDLICPPVPEDLAVEWIDDFAQITFTDMSGGRAKHEIWEQVDGGGYELVTTLDAGIETYDYYTWQNADLDFKIRSRSGGSYSAFTAEESIVSPLVFRSDQTVLNTLTIQTFTISGAHTINIDWGDGNDDDFGTGVNPNITHDYILEDIYFVQLSGDLDYLADWEMYNQEVLGSISKWNFPVSCIRFHLYNEGFTGNPLDRPLNPLTGIIHFNNNDLSGDVTDCVLNDVLYDFRFDNNAGLYGDTTAWQLPLANGKVYFYFEIPRTQIGGLWTGKQLPANTKLLSLYGTQIEWDLTGIVWPVNCGFLILGSSAVAVQANIYGDLTGMIWPAGFAATIGYTIGFYGLGLAGDLSGAASDLPSVGAVMKFYLGQNDFTKLPRGEYEWVNVFDVSGNNCDQTEIDNYLVYLDSYFVGAKVPLANCSYDLSGSGMGIPSAIGLAARTSIIGKYVAAGKTCTITVNT